jgi:predicted transcriptional regulator YdeE
MEPRIVTKPAFTVVGLKYSGGNARRDLPRLWEQFVPRMSEIRHKLEQEISYGLTTTYDRKNRTFEYIAGVEVNSAEDVPEGMVSFEVPEQTYAVFTATMPTFVRTYKRVINRWLPKSGHKRIEGPEFEVYTKEFDPQAKDERAQYEFYLPVE